MNNHLFQSAEFYQRRYHNFATILVLPLTLLVLFIVLFSLFAQTEVTVTSTGEITPTKVIEVIQSTSNNIISTNNLKDNKTVKKVTFSLNTLISSNLPRVMAFSSK